MAFVVPCISIFVCYARIFYIVRKTAMRSHDSNNLANSIRIRSSSSNSNDQTRRMFQTNNNRKSSDGTDTHLLPKTQSISNGTHCKNGENGKELFDSDHSSLSHSHSHGDMKNEKFIDGNGENDYASTLSVMRKNIMGERNLSNVSIARTVEFISENGDRNKDMMERDTNFKINMLEVDSAMEESTSSVDNTHQVCIILSFVFSKSTKNNEIEFNTFFILFSNRFRFTTSKVIVIVCNYFRCKLNHRQVLASIYHWTMTVHQGTNSNNNAD